MTGEAEQAQLDDAPFRTVRDELNEFNFFLLSAGISPSERNVIGAVRDTMRFLALRPAVDYDASLQAFVVRKVTRAQSLIECLKVHVPLFKAFDSARVKKEFWGINSMNKNIVKIIVKLDPSTSESLQKSIKKAADDAKMAGWPGRLEIISASSTTITFP